MLSTGLKLQTGAFRALKLSECNFKYNERVQSMSEEEKKQVDEEEEEEEEGINDPNFIWDGVCLDDGTGRDVYFVKIDGSVRQRRVPHGYRPEYLDNGERRYYYRKVCIRCRKGYQQIGRAHV